MFQIGRIILTNLFQQLAKYLKKIKFNSDRLKKIKDFFKGNKRQLENIDKDVYIFEQNTKGRNHIGKS